MYAPSSVRLLSTLASRAFEIEFQNHDFAVATRSSFRCAPRSERDARGTSRVSAARARVTTGMADARATMERLASLAKAQVRFDPARRPEESGHPPIRRRVSRQLCSYPRPDALPPSRA